MDLQDYDGDPEVHTSVWEPSTLGALVMRSLSVCVCVYVGMLESAWNRITMEIFSYHVT